MDVLREVGLHEMPNKWFEQAQLVLWPKETPVEPFLQVVHCDVNQHRMRNLSSPVLPSAPILFHSGLS